MYYKRQAEEKRGCNKWCLFRISLGHDGCIGHQISKVTSCCASSN